MGVNGIYGLSGSGLDIESMVKMGMMTKQSQYNKMYQKEVSNTWLKEAYNNVYTDLYKFKNTSLSTYKMQSNMNAMSASSTDTSVVSAVANGAAASMSHKVSVSQIASNAYLMTDSGKSITRANTSATATSTSLADVMFQSHSLTSGTASDKNSVYSVTDANGTTKTVNGSDTAVSLTLNDGETTKTLTYTYDQLFSDEKSLYDLASAIASTGVNIQGNYDSTNDSFSFYNKTTGEKNKIGLTAGNSDTANLLNNLNLASYNANDNSLTVIDKFQSAEDKSSSLSTSSISRMNTSASTSTDLKDILFTDFEQIDVDSYNKTFQDQIDSIDSQITSLNAKKAGYQASIDALDTTSATYETTKAGLESMIADVDTEISDYTTQKNTYSSQLLKTDGTKYYKSSIGKTDDDGNKEYYYPISGDTQAASFKLSNGTDSKIIDITYDELASMGLDGLAQKINDAGLSGVTASYDSTSGKFSITNSSGDISLTSNADDSNDYDVTDHLLSQLGMVKTSGAEQSFAGTNAHVTVDGKAYDLATNKQTIAGVTYTFNSISETGKTTTVNVSQDTDKIVDYVKQFVSEYNTLLDSLNDKLSESKYSDYKPLTSSQEEQMTESQITKWNEKAKSGLLYHNSTIQSLVSSMREAIYTKVDAVDSEYNTLSSIGITSSTTKGHLTLDEDTLKEALAADPDCVYQLFASDQDSSYISGSTNTKKLSNSQKKLDYQNTGIANRLTSVMSTYIDTISDYAGTSTDTDDESYLGNLITNLQTKMSTFKTQMNAYEDLLYDKYDAMEVALSNLGTQLSYITGSSS